MDAGNRSKKRAYLPLYITMGGLLVGTALLPLVAGCAAPPAAQADALRTNVPRVEVLRVPDGGYQQQAVVDAQGVIHLVYLKGEASGADLYYTRGEGDRWATPLRIGPPGAAVGMGTIRGPQLALGRDAKVHVVWFGSAKSGMRGPEESAPLLYSRLNDAGSSFEPVRNVMQASTSLDGGPGVAADGAGNVYVVWHAAEHKGEREDTRRLWIARSSDEGKSFSREASAWNDPTGACPCCSTEAFADSKGRLYMLYRMAANRSERDMVLVTSTDRGRTFQGSRIDPWPVDT